MWTGKFRLLRIWEKLPAFTYYPTFLEKSRQPFDWYKALVLEGARENEFPQHYLVMIESMESVVDSGQHQKNDKF